ncbi:MAG: hypothetical protein CVT48_02330 [Thermoplasmata archaeon HGW-Thermoplasmata-1]|nr:MAG: hypothetical protein CVT48_02330 [Thermoplasmata archaeon HGW-Thermoplasmata-1]
MTKRVKCPKCGTIVEVEEGAKPVCHSCGFGGQAKSKTPDKNTMKYVKSEAGGKMEKPMHPPIGRRTGKVRKPGIVLLLMIITFGIYGIIWYYCTFEELKNWRGQGWGGVLYLVFQFLFPIPLVAIPWLIPAYIGRMYEEDGREKPITGLSGFWIFVPLAGMIIWLVKVQKRLNEFWTAKDGGY